MRVALVIAALLLVAMTLVPMLRADAWWIRVFDFPRLQIVELSLLVLLGGAFVWDLKNPWEMGTAALLLLAVGLQLHRIYPYLPVAPQQVVAAAQPTPDATLSLLVANVLMSNRDVDRFLDVVRAADPDVVLTLEPDAWWEAQLRVLEADYPHTVKQPQDNRYGLLLYARRPLIEPEVKFLIQDGIPSVHTRVQLPGGQQVWLHGLHPEPPSPTEADSSTQRDAELLIVGDHIQDRDQPTLVAGDLNDVAWSYTTTLFQKISGLLDPRRGRGLYNTYNAQFALMRWPLDHVFHSDHFTLVEMRRMPAFGSDHFPVYIKLHLERGAEAEQDAPEADAEEEEQAQEKMNKVQQQESM